MKKLSEKQLNKKIETAAREFEEARNNLFDEFVERLIQETGLDEEEVLDRFGQLV